MNKFKVSLIIAFLGMVTLVGAQTASLSVKGGLNLSNFYSDDYNDKNVKPGFHIGLGADLEFMQNLSFQTGLYYSSKGAKYQYYSAITDNIEFNVSANYLQLPIHVAYKIDVTPGTKVVFHAGPYLAYGIGGKRKIVSQYTNDLEQIFGKQDINTFDKDHGLKPFDTGVGVGVGAEFGLITIDLGWDLGLTNISRLENNSVKNQSAYLSLGYKF